MLLDKLCKKRHQLFLRRVIFLVFVGPKRPKKYQPPPSKNQPQARLLRGQADCALFHTNPRII